MATEEVFVLMDKTTPSFFTQFLAQLQETMGKNFVSEKRFCYLGV